MNPAICPSCGQAALVQMEEKKTYTPPTGAVTVDLITSQCGNCGARITTRQQHAQNLQALAARKSAYGEWLTGEEVLSLRRRYGITQQQASSIFGKGTIAFSRYENETSYPDRTMTRLMRVAFNDAGIMRQLAAEARVELPLLEKRLSEEFMRVVTHFIAAQRVESGALNTTRTKTTGSLETFGRFDRVFADFYKKINALTYPSTTKTANGSAASSAANDERFALAA